MNKENKIKKLISDIEYLENKLARAKNKVEVALIRISHAYEINRVSDVEVKEWKGKK